VKKLMMSAGIICSACVVCTVAVTKDGFDLKTKTDTIHVELSDPTKFELDSKAVSKNPVRKGQRVGGCSGPKHQAR
jgi:hypothetical protein